MNHTQPASNWSLTDDEEMTLLKFSLDSSNPSDDIWRKFALPSTPPLTPPCSPSRSFGESSDCDETTDNNDLDRLHDVSESLDSTFDICSNRSCSRAIDHLHSKLISDCMWSGNHPVEPITSQPVYLNKTEYSKKFTIESEEELYPTPCPSPSPSASDSADYSSSSDCVDPTSVFPYSLTNDSMSSQSESDEEIDVVTVDTKPVTIETGLKRKLNNLTKPNVIFAKIQTTPLLKKSKSLPAKFSQNIIASSRRVPSVSSATSTEDSDPETRRVNRVNHNVLERKRRIDLKKNFERLRDCVPNIESRDKAPKVIVLKKASEYVYSLTKQEVDLCKQKVSLQNQKDMLLCKIERYIKAPRKY